MFNYGWTEDGSSLKSLNSCPPNVFPVHCAFWLCPSSACAHCIQSCTGHTDNELSPSPPSRVQMVSVSFHLRKYITNLMISINWLLVDALKNQEFKNRIIDDVLRRTYVYDLIHTLRAQTHGLGHPNVYALWNEVNSDDPTISTTPRNSLARKHCTRQNFVIKTHEKKNTIDICSTRERHIQEFHFSSESMRIKAATTCVKCVSQVYESCMNGNAFLNGVN